MKHTIAFSLGIALLGAGMGTAHAQRAPIDRSDRRAQRQQMMQGMTPEQRQQFFQNRRQQRSNARTGSQNAANGFTPNAGRQTVQGGARGGQGNQGTNASRTRTRGGNSAATLSPAERETLMRGLMKSAGITDKAQQDPIVAFVFAQSKAREPLLKSAREIATSLRDGKTTPDQISAKWASYQTDVDEDKIRFEKELEALDKKIGWSKDPRLKSFLSLVGVLGPDTFVIGGAVAIFGPESPVRAVSTTTVTPRAATAPRAN